MTKEGASSNALVGSTGYVGSSLIHQMDFDFEFNSKNIAKIRGMHFDLLVVAAAPAKKWIANQNPESDFTNIQNLIRDLGECTANHLVLISTIDVFTNSVGRNELSADSFEKNDAYGRNRHFLEEALSAIFPKCTIIRLPGLVGRNLQKNAVYDLKNGNEIFKLNANSNYQFYPIDNLASDIVTCIELGAPIVHLVSPPLNLGKIAKDIFQIDLQASHESFANYDLRTIHAETFGGWNEYTYSEAEVYNSIRNYLKS